MKKNFFGIFAMTVMLVSCSSSSSSTKMQQTVTSKTINGELVVTVETTKDGVTTNETFNGKAAEAKLKELDKNMAGLEKVEEIDPLVVQEKSDDHVPVSENRKINMINEDGKKTLTIEESRNGKTTKETYTGKEAEEKMKELESE